MIIHCLYDHLFDIKTLKLNFHPKNRNAHSQEQIERLAKILSYQGVRYPVKLSYESGKITSGHGRVLAAEYNGWKEFPVVIQHYDNDVQEYADLTADNAIASWSELDFAGINSDLSDLGPDLDVDMLGIKNFVVDPIEKLEPGCDEDEVPEHVEPNTRLGDLYILGNHRLLCGDSTSVDTVEKLMNGEKADMVFTDPPYIGMVGAEWDKTDLDWQAVFSNLFIATKEESNIIMTGQTPIIFRWYPLLIAAFEFVQDMVWVKQRAVNLSQSNFARRHENVLWFKRGDKYFDAQSSRTDTNIERVNKWSDSKMVKGRKGGMKGGEETVHGFTAQSLLEFGRVYHHHEEYEGHPTQKPTALISYLLECLSKLNTNVLDLFGGSGSTLIACEKTNRRCFMMELDPHYCDIIVSRWELYTGKKAELVA